VVSYWIKLKIRVTVRVRVTVRFRLTPTVSSQILIVIDASQLDARLNFPLGRFPLRRYLFILVQYILIFYVQFI